jgi:hypothetical protein
VPRRLFLWIYLFVLAPIGAFVVLTALLLFHVSPRLVFAPGFALKSLLQACGFPVANRIAVAATAVFYWAVIAALGLVRERRRRH